MSCRFLSVMSATRVFLIAVILAAFVPATGFAQQSGWTTFVDPDFGAVMDYPADLFEALPRKDGEVNHPFATVDGSARLVMGTWENLDADTPGRLKNRLLDESLPDSVTYDPRGRSWFVVSGYKGDEIYYQKAMFTCDGRLVSAFGLAYPVAERRLYDPVVERIEDSFRPARDCPIR